MYTPPQTRTEDDARKELKNIELKINVAKTGLEIAGKRRADAEAGFVAREKKIDNKELKFKTEEDSLKKDIVGKKNDILELDKMIESKNREISGLKIESSNADDEIINKGKESERLEKEASAKRKSLNETALSIDEKIDDKNSELEKIVEEIGVNEKLNSELKRDNQKTLDYFAERELELQEMEKGLDKRKRDLRIHSQRLVRLYGAHAPEVKLNGLI